MTPKQQPMNRLEFFQTRKGKAHLYQKRTGRRFNLMIKDIEPQSKKMKAAEQDALQEQIMKTLNERRRLAYRGPITLQIDLATTGRTAPQAQTIAKNFLDLFSTRRPKVSGRRAKLLYRDDRQIQALSVSCRHGRPYPHIAIRSQRFSDALKDLELAAEAARSSGQDWHREWEEETDGDSIKSFRDLLKNREHSRSRLGDDTYEALLKMTRWQAQRALLNRSRVSTEQLALLYGLPRDRGADALHAQWKDIFRDHALRVTLGELPQVDGQSDPFKQQIDLALAAFKQRWDWVMQPLVNAVALEVIVSTSASLPKDLDNIVRDYLLPRFVPAFGTVTDYTFTTDFEELAKRDPGILTKWKPMPPKSTRDGVTRYEVWRLPPASPGSSGFVSVALVVDDGRRLSAFHQIDDELTRWAAEVESADS